MKKTPTESSWRPWWQVPLHNSPNGRRLHATVVLLMALLLLVPQRAGAVLGSDISGTGFWYRFLMRNYTYNSNNNGNKPYVDFSIPYCYDYTSYTEGFMAAQGGLNILVSPDDGKNWVKIINVKTDANHNFNTSEKIEGCDKSGTPYAWSDGTIGTTYHHYVRWYLPLAWRNCKLIFKFQGKWCDKDGVNNVHEIFTNDDRTLFEKYTAYKFQVRTISWNGNFSISPNGTITIPYKFGSACNTDGNTRIWTFIDNQWESKIPAKELGNNYNAGTYSFKLKDIGKDFRCKEFKIQPLHEFRHDWDMDSNDKDKKKKYTDQFAETKAFAPFPIAVIEKTEFDQDSNRVTITWKGDNSSYSIGKWGTSWAIYRNGEYVGTVLQQLNDSEYTNPNYDKKANSYFFVDKDFPNETNLEYQIYYVWRDWDKKEKVEELKSTTKTENCNKVNTTRTVPVKDAQAICYDDRIEFSWTSDIHSLDYGHEFRIYVDNEKSPIYTITPTDSTGVFKWIHRTTDLHSDRQEDIDENGIPYVEEPLNACAPHTYRIQGVVKGKELENDKVIFTNRAIGNGTLFYSLDATKGVYPGKVNLSWRVNKQGSYEAKTYIVERRTAENNDEEWTQLTRMSSADDNLTYSDDTPLPGVFYDYRVTVIDKCSEGTEITNDKTDIGFAQTTGTLSGRITFGSAGTSVVGVDVEAKKTGTSAENGNQYHSMRFTNNAGAVKWTYPNKTYAAKKFADNDFSIQLWLSPDELNEAKMIRLNNETCYIGMNSNGKLTLVNGEDSVTFNNLQLAAKQYNHVALTRKAGTLIGYLITTDDEGIAKATKDTLTIEGSLDLDSAVQFSLGYYQGYADEFRLWTKCLTEAEILENYDHLLVGNEAGLETYWTFDEGLKHKFFDYSRALTVFHQHHGELGNNTESALFTPEQLKLKAKTDKDGNFIIQGVPFSGEGTTYAIIPKLNTHEFTPTQQLRFVSNNSLVHNGTDFTDVSSFPVSGTVLYSGTTYPVEGVNFYVDGVACTRDGKMVATNSDGEFEISVPIGEHYIQAVLNGHVFVNNGRYPADPEGLGEKVKANFDRKITGLEFRDTTLVNFTGRVVGGDIENAYPVGFGLSQNNIGITRLTLNPVNTSPYINAVKEKISDTSFEYKYNTETVSVPSATDEINSKSWRGGGSVPEARTIYIETDSVTGEFSALLPPLEYALGNMMVRNTGTIVGNGVTIDLTQPMIENSDTLTLEDGSYQVYTYNTKLTQAYHSEPQLVVTQEGRTDGSFGIKSYKFQDEINTIIDNIYEIDADGNVKYNYGVSGHEAPLFLGGKSYTFNLEGFEEYKNYDGDPNHEKAVVKKVPLRNVEVTIGNALSDGQSVWINTGKVTLDSDGQTYDAVAGQVFNLKNNKLLLDEDGKAIYQWTAGIPNVTEPYTRTISMTYDINGRHYQWSDSGLEGIILGDMPTGNNFVTAGPDHLTMILRDPPGTGSSAEWSTGSTTTTTTLRNNTWSDSEETGFTSHLGKSNDVMTGTASGVPGAQAVTLAVTKIDAKDDLTTHVVSESEGESGETIEETTTITKAVATSGESDFVGSDGDIFIGRSTNIIFGDARRIGFKRENSDFSIGLRNVISTSLNPDSTTFMYTQSYIKNTLLPNFKKIRQSMLRWATKEEINQYNPVKNVGTHNKGKNAGNLYLTNLTPDDENYGEEGTYTLVVPNPYEAMPDSVKKTKEQLLTWLITEGYATADSVEWINNQIKTWENNLKLNEEEKVLAYELHKKNDPSVQFENYSFDGGSSYTYTVENDSTHTSTWEQNVKAGIKVANRLGFEINNTGVDWDLEISASGGLHESTETANGTNTSFSYTLAEEGSDAITVDVYQYGAFGPIFRTRAGQTSNPYEDEDTTSYYNPGTVIMEKTMQIEVPQISVDKFEISDVPTGSAANYTLHLSNASEIGEDVAYRLFFLDETNPNGAQLSIDGSVLTSEGRLFKVPGSQTLDKALQIRQTDIGVLDYDSIAVVFASDSQPDEIYGIVYLSTHFTPSSSPVTLAMSTRTMNILSGTDLVLTIKDFDRNYKNLKAFRLQYKKEGSTDWTQLKEYVLNEADKTDNNELLPSGATVDFSKPFAAFSDGNYIFRCVSAATYGTEEVYRYSDEIALIKDMVKPRPLGTPEPADGVLDIGDDVTISFNETIVKGELTKLNNFTITGVLNGAEIDHETALNVNSGTKKAAAAKTEASINLNGKDFSIDTWMNITGAGTLLSHGQGNQELTVGTNADGKLVVTIANNTYTSKNVVPTGKWAFLSMNVTADGKLTATVATADETVPLFNNMDVVSYAGNGPLSVGCGSAAAMHELLLWDEAHDITTALANRSKSKAPSTRHLIGYWKMNEGEGKEIRDYSRNRNMIMPDETWYINNVNKAVSLDGQHYVSINTSMLPISEYDDYAVEFWMRGDKQTGEAQLMQMGEVALSLNENGELMLTGKGASTQASQSDAQISVPNSQLTDNAWHHIALNVLRQGAAAVYVDGKRCLTTNAANVGAINTDKLVMGVRRIYDETIGGTDQHTYDHAFKGEIDEVRVWGATMNGDLLTKNRKVRFTGQEGGLKAYYPFETKTLDDYNQVVTVGTAKDITGSGLQAELKSLNSEPSTLNYVDNAPALRTKPAETNVNFSYVASDEKIVIEIDEDPATIEGCTLNFNIRNVGDMNGNYSSDAIWSAYVNRKELVWEDDNLSVEQHVKEETDVTATIKNLGGKQQMWTLTGLPEWLTASSEYGTTNPRNESKVTFTVAPSAPLGRHEATIYLSGNDGIDVPLTLNIKVNGDIPNWAVNANDFENSMNVIGQVQIDNLPVDDEDDILAAFIGEECRGVAHPVYNARYDACYITMDIYGNTNVENGDAKKAITFRAYDASTGTLYPVVTPSKAIVFDPLTLVGNYKEPVTFDVEDIIEQSVELKKGWNWISMNVNPKQKSVPAVFEKIAGNVTSVKSQTEYLSIENGVWGGNLTGDMNNTEMYAVQMKEPCTLRIVGQRIEPADNVITVEKGWNWIGYYGQQVASVANALSGLEKSEGDILKGQRGVSYYDVYEWSGSLSIMEPNVGYILMINGDGNYSFSYPSSTVSRYTKAYQFEDMDEVTSTEETSAFHPVSFRKYPYNATMAVKVLNGGVALSNSELGIFADEECRAMAQTNAQGVAYLTIPGEDETTLCFKVAVDDEIVDAPTVVTFEADGVYGTPTNPLVIELDEATSLNDVLRVKNEDSIYDLSGRKIKIQNSGDAKRSNVNSKLNKGVYIINGQKRTVK